MTQSTANAKQRRFLIKTYIIRIYREERDDPHSLVGIVEEVGREGRRAFSNLDELWELLKSRGGNTGNEEGPDGKREKWADPVLPGPTCA